MLTKIGIYRFLSKFLPTRALLVLQDILLKSNVAKINLGGYEAYYRLKNREVINYIVDRRFGGEEEILKKFIDDLNDSNVLFDIGANIGVYSAFALNNSSVKVNSFEPIPANKRMLKENLDLNGSKYRIFELALSSNENYQKDFMEIGEGERKPEASLAGEGLEVSKISGDSLISEKSLECPDIMKIDVEGHEMDVLEGFSENLEGIEILYVEIHQESDKSKVIDYLERRNFHVEPIKEESKYLRAVS